MKTYHHPPPPHYHHNSHRDTDNLNQPHIGNKYSYTPHPNTVSLSLFLYSLVSSATHSDTPRQYHLPTLPTYRKYSTIIRETPLHTRRRYATSFDCSHQTEVTACQIPTQDSSPKLCDKKTKKRMQCLHEMKRHRRACSCIRNT